MTVSSLLMISCKIQSSHRGSRCSAACPGWLQITFSLPPSGPTSNGGTAAAGAAGAAGAAPGAAADSSADSSGFPDSGFRSAGEGLRSPGEGFWGQVLL